MYAAYAELQELVLHVLISLALRSKIFSSSSYHHCYSSESPRSFPSIFWHHWGYAPRFSSFQFQSWLMLRSEVFSEFHNIMDATLSALFLTSLMLCFKNLSSFFNHQWCGALRSSVQLSNIMVSTLYGLLFKFLPSLMLGRSCLQFANLVAATLEGLLFNVPTFYHHWCYDPKSSL